MYLVLVQLSAPFDQRKDATVDSFSEAFDFSHLSDCLLSDVLPWRVFLCCFSWLSDPVLGRSKTGVLGF